MIPKRLSKGNWREGGLFYLMFSLNSSKTIIFDIFLDLPLLNDEYEYVFEGEKGLGPTGLRFAPVCSIGSKRGFLVKIWNFYLYYEKSSQLSRITSE